MYYLNEADLQAVGFHWDETIDAIEDAVRCLHDGDFAQPIKPYLRYRDLTNRIIAMPAFVGGKVNLAGIKWIASFPGNIDHGIPRAHSVVILNKADTGEPFCIINTALLSIIRTASVSGLMIRHFLAARPMDSINLAIIGWGPIGRHHFKMATSILGDRLNKVFLYDLRGVDVEKVDPELRDKIVVTNSWQDAYTDTDIFITATVSKAPYVDLPPKAGSLQLNCSLRDYQISILDHTKAIIVDDWEECCREKTDVEMMHLNRGLQEKDTKSIGDVVVNQCMKEYPADEPVMFNPMGMAIFDMATAGYYLEKAKSIGRGQELD